MGTENAKPLGTAPKETVNRGLPLVILETWARAYRCPDRASTDAARRLRAPARGYRRPEASAAASAASSWRSTRSRPRVPEAGVGEVDADDLRRAPRAASSRRRAAARGSRGTKLGALLLVARVDRQREQLAVGVRVDVAGRADEVRDVGPPRAVALGDLDRVAEQLAPASRPTARRSARPTARPPRGARCARGPRSGSSRSGGTRSRSCPRGSRRAARAATPASASSSSRRPNDDRLAEHRRGLGERQRRASGGRRPAARRARRARRGRARARA